MVQRFTPPHQEKGERREELASSISFFEILEPAASCGPIQMALLDTAAQGFFEVKDFIGGIEVRQDRRVGKNLYVGQARIHEISEEIPPNPTVSNAVTEYTGNCPRCLYVVGVNQKRCPVWLYGNDAAP